MIFWGQSQCNVTIPGGSSNTVGSSDLSCHANQTRQGLAELQFCSIDSAVCPRVKVLFNLPFGASADSLNFAPANLRTWMKAFHFLTGRSKKVAIVASPMSSLMVYEITSSMVSAATCWIAMIAFRICTASS